MINETNSTQGSNSTQFSLPPILRNKNAEKDSNEPGSVGDINNQTTPTETSRHAARADNSSGEAAQAVNGSPTNHLSNKFQAVIYGENGTRAEFTYESMDEVPKWFVNKVVGNYQKVEKLGSEEKNSPQKPQTVIHNNNRYEIMRDKYETNGQAGAVGPKAHAHDMDFNQLWNQSSSEIDLPGLAEELLQLRQALKEEAKTLEHDTAVGEIAAAATAAEAGDGPKALEHLKNAGRWTLGVAEKIGTALATAALKTALGL